MRKRLYDLLEHEVIPLFYDRDEHGVPQRWCERIKHALDHARSGLQRQPHDRRVRREDLPRRLTTSRPRRREAAASIV